MCFDAIVLKKKKKKMANFNTMCFLLPFKLSRCQAELFSSPLLAFLSCPLAKSSADEVIIIYLSVFHRVAEDVSVMHN